MILPRALLCPIRYTSAMISPERDEGMVLERWE
jgi:hypothetical protein